MRYAERNSVYGINKARLIKRVAAACLDFVLFALIAIGFSTLISTISNYDGYRAQLDAKYEEYGLYAEYDPTLSEEEQPTNIFCSAVVEGDACDLAWQAFYADEEAVQLLHTCSNITIVTVSVGILGGALITYFLIPLFLKNGQSFGKKFMRIALINTEGIRVKNINLFVRCLFGIYVVELMIPFYAIFYILSGSPGSIIALAVVSAILIADIMLMMGSRYGQAIHDMIGKTIVVELDGQAIFDTVEELQKHKQKEEQKNLEYAKKKGY